MPYLCPPGVGVCGTVNAPRLMKSKARTGVSIVVECVQLSVGDHKARLYLCQAARPTATLNRQDERFHFAEPMLAML